MVYNFWSFDCNYGCKKAQNYVSYNTFLESIIEISKNINAKIFLKSKLSYDQNHNQGDIKIKKNLEIIRATKNIEYLDITANTEQIINNSDLHNYRIRSYLLLHSVISPPLPMKLNLLRILKNFHIHQ